MTKILTLVASRRSPGNSELLAREASAGAELAGAHVELLNIAKLNIAPCEGCLGCVFRGKCAEQDDMDMLIEKFLEADGLIVSAPIYLLSPASVVKKIMDRALMMALYIDELSQRKRGALSLSVAGKADWNPIGMEVLNQMALSYGFPIFNYLETYAPGPGEILLQEDTIEETHNLGYGLVKYIEGNSPARAPEENQCPSCYSRSFRLLGNNRVQCPFCLVEGTMDSQGAIHIPEEILNDAFWTPKHRKRHLEDWIKATRGVFLKNRPAIKEKLEKYL